MDSLTRKMRFFSSKPGRPRALFAFAVGGGFERFNFEVDAEGDDFLGQMDTSYTAATLYLKGQF